MAKNRLLSIDCWTRDSGYNDIITFNRGDNEQRFFASDVQLIRLHRLINRSGGRLTLKPLGWSFYTEPLNTNGDYLIWEDLINERISTR